MTTQRHMPKIRILVTSVSAKIPLLRELRKATEKIFDDVEIWGGDTDQNCVGRYFVDEFWKMPEIDALEVEELVAFCRGKNITAIIPTRDGELTFFAGHRDRLREKGISVMVSSSEGVRSCLDKIAFYEATRRHAPDYAIATATETAHLNTTSYVVKERYGAGSKDILVNASRNKALEHACRLTHPIFQPYITGQEYSIDLYLNRDAIAIGAVARTRDLVAGGESRITTTVRNDRLEQACSALASRLGLSGHLVMQVIIDPKGDFHFIECNCRFGGASTLSVAAGLDSFTWFLSESLGEALAPPSFIRLPGEFRQVRYSEDMLIEMTD